MSVRRAWTLLCFLVWGLTARAQGDSIVFSLLTCSPGKQVYSLYGHTGLRMRNAERGVDVVFNYGVFDFRRPHFTWHFILGECDYQLMVYDFAGFLGEYRARGSSVTEQELLLSGPEANRLMAALLANAQPEHRTYRYNFLTNNCTTRVRDQIEAAVDGTVVYEEAEEHPTYRQLLHHYTQGYDWAEAGNDLLLGAEADVVAGDRGAQFLPERLMDYVAGAQVFDSLNNRRPLLGETHTLVEARPRAEAARWYGLALQEDGGQWLPTPLGAGLALLALMLSVFLAERKTGRMMWLVDALVMTAQGVAGVLVCLLFFFSVHPTVGSNWHVWLLNPLPLVCMPWVVSCAAKGRICLYHYLNALSLTLFLVFMPWIPQSFPVLTPLLALALLTRPVSYYLRYKDEGARGIED